MGAVFLHIYPIVLERPFRNSIVSEKERVNWFLTVEYCNIEFLEDRLQLVFLDHLYR